MNIYLWSDKKLFLKYENKFFCYEYEDLEDVLEEIKLDFENVKEKIETSLVLHFSFFNYIISNDEGNKEEINKQNYYTYKYFTDHVHNVYVEFFIEKEKLKNIIKKFKSHNLKEIKIDMISLYNFLKEEDNDVLILGSHYSYKMEIINSKISSLEKIDISVLNDDNVDDYDFGDIIVIDENEENIDMIFQGSELYKEPNLLNQKSKLDFFGDKSTILKILGIVVALLFILFYTYLNSSTEKLKNELDGLRVENRELEETYLKNNIEEVEDYSEEISRLNNFFGDMQKKEHYYFPRFLINRTSGYVDYKKMNYSDGTWIIEGEVNNVDRFFIFERSLKKRYGNVVLEYIKDRNNKVVFSYKIIE